jgi:hypothetical protein
MTEQAIKLDPVIQNLRKLSDAELDRFLGEHQELVGMALAERQRRKKVRRDNVQEHKN